MDALCKMADYVEMLVEYEVSAADLREIAQHATGPLLKALEDKVEAMEQDEAERHFEDFGDQYRDDCGVMVHAPTSEED